MARQGSSPHTRGAHPKAIRRLHRERIIPAYAGSTCAAGPRPSAQSDHPRIRGEHGEHARVEFPCYGSSPHTRGAPARRGGTVCRRRIIPAYAGSTAGRSSSRTGSSGSSPHTRGAHDLLGDALAPIGDHPRIRGEHHQPATTDPLRDGSSPHTRGAPQLRLVPASPASDHPRIRGEHMTSPNVFVPASGSSPHTRGARSQPGPVGKNARIIPAYAGSTWLESIRWKGREDHPRIRGEH